MSYFSVTNFIKSGKDALENKNYWSALSVALMLPSICSRIMFNSNEYKGINRNDEAGYWYESNDGKAHWRDKKCYIDFCKEVMRVNRSSSNPEDCYDSWLVNTLGYKFADVLYQLRCDIVHAGSANIYNDGIGIYLTLGETLPSTEFSRYRIVNVKDLCETLFAHINAWCSCNSADNFKYTYVFDAENNNDDRILYNRLCDNERADILEKEFLKENERRMMTS